MKYFNNNFRRQAPSLFNDSLTFVDSMLDNLWSSYHTEIQAQEKDDSYSFEVELPGFDKKDVSVTINENNELKVHALNKETKKERSKRIILPKDINSDTIKANLKNGLLKITIFKGSKKSSKIKIE